jgi:NADPH:quinone reductase-like Zn-dependent oxidoreductase
MKAVVMSGYGKIDVLQIKDIPIFEPTTHDLLVEVHACSLNPVDYKIRNGTLKELLPITFPHILGGDVSGVVNKVGAGVSDFKIGDEVYFANELSRGGGNAEFCLVHQNLVAKKPKSISHVQAASLPVVGLTAIQALRDFSHLKSGNLVLIHAGAGGLGSFAIQYAKNSGATVYTTASRSNHEYLKSLGADHIIDYQKEDFVEICQKQGGVDIVLESVGGLSYPRSILATKKGGYVPCPVNPPDSDTIALSKQRNIHTDFFLLRGITKDLEEIANLVDSGIIHPTVTRTLALEEIAFGHTQLESGRTRGKWVLQIR